MTSAMSDLKVGFSIVAGFSLVYAACVWLDDRNEFSAEAEAKRRQQGWVTIVPPPDQPARAVD